MPVAEVLDHALLENPIGVLVLQQVVTEQQYAIAFLDFERSGDDFLAGEAGAGENERTEEEQGETHGRGCYR